MQIIAPTYIDDAKLVSSDIPEVPEGYAEWTAAATWMTGQRCVITTTDMHCVYECAWGTGNVNKYPPDNLSGTPVYWTYISKTNRWKLFDLIVAPDRATVGTNSTIAKWASGVKWQPDTVWDSASFSSMQATILPGLIDTVAVMNVDCTSIALILTDPDDGEVYNEIKTPSISAYVNAIYSDIPAYPNATLQVVVKNTAGSVKVGELVVGRVRTIGKARYGLGVGLVDYSAKSTDAFGNFSIVERAFSKRLDVNFTMELVTHAGIMRLLEKYRSVPLVWIVSNLYSTTVVYGFYRDLQISIPNTRIAEGSVSIEGLGGDYVHAEPIPDVYVPPWDGINHLSIEMVGNETDPLPSGSAFRLWVSGLAATKIEETPVVIEADDLDTLTVPAVPGVATSLTLYNLAGADGVCTISNATPAVVTCNGHGLADDQEVIFHTTGALPAPLVADTVYYVVYVGVNTFNLSLTAPGSTIDTTTDGSGTHTVLGKA